MHGDYEYEGAKYYMYLPESVKDPNIELPIIVYFHQGAGYYTNDSYGSARAHIEKYIDEEKPEAIIISLLYSLDSKGLNKLSKEAVNVSNHIVDVYKADKNKISIMGCSTGGVAAWYAATINPTYYSAVASIAGSGLSFRNVNKLVDAPTWIIALYDASRIFGRRLVDANLKAGANNIYFTLVNDKHAEAYNVALRKMNLIDWLIVQEKGKQPILPNCSGSTVKIDGEIFFTTNTVRCYVK